MSKNPKPSSYQFHPLELSFVGHSNSGKTTLIEKLLGSELKTDWSVAYIKHDVHGFDVDRAGKDTFRAREAGAMGSYISSPESFALMAGGELSIFQRRSLFLDFDAVIVEGYKASDMDKIVVLDKDYAILKDLPEESLSKIQAFVGPDVGPKYPLPIDRPYFHRDNVQYLIPLIQNLWRARLRERPMYGLVLAGGFSTRMGQDKGLIPYHGQPEALRAVKTLEELGLPTFLSLRAGQWPSDAQEGRSVIQDQFQNFGPLGGILSAMQTAPDAAWLVVACDLPFLSAEVLTNLIEHRQPQKMATAYRSTTDGLPEPLCAIYEPAIRMRMLEALGLGISCPRKVLLNTPSVIIKQIDARALTNANTPEDYAAITQQISLKEMSL